MNGTYVNGLPVQQRALEDGDQIQIGRSLFAFATREPSRPDSSTNMVALDDRHYTTGATVMVRVADSPHFHAEKLLEGLPQVWRNARHLAILLKLGAAVQASRSVEALESAHHQAIFDAVPAPQAAVMLYI